MVFCILSQLPEAYTTKRGELSLRESKASAPTKPEKFASPELLKVELALASTS